VRLHSIDLRLAHRLKDREFRREWFRAELEDIVPEMFKKLREERGFTQSELAQKTGMKQSAISRFERDREARWNFETLLKLAEALDAQLTISVIRAEDVIARYERKESSKETKGGSVLDATWRHKFEQNEKHKKDKPSILDDQRPNWTEEIKRSNRLLGEPRWNSLQ